MPTFTILRQWSDVPRHQIDDRWLPTYYDLRLYHTFFCAKWHSSVSMDLAKQHGKQGVLHELRRGQHSLIYKDLPQAPDVPEHDGSPLHLES